MPNRSSEPLITYQISLVDDSQTDLRPVDVSNPNIIAAVVFIQPVRGNIGDVYLMGDTATQVSQGFAIAPVDISVGDYTFHTLHGPIDMARLKMMADNDGDAVRIAIQPLSG